MQSAQINHSIKYGTPIELGIQRQEYLPQIRKLYRNNSRGLFTKLSDKDLANGTLRRIPFFRFFDEMVQYKPDALQLAHNAEQRVVGFFGSPIDVPLDLAKWLSTPNFSKQQFLSLHF
jgi:hypothetical protein